MARVKYSAIGVTDIKGTSGGTVFQGALGGGVIRRRVKPVNTRSNAQVEQRAKFAQNAQAWRALTVAQRAAWEGAAKTGDWPFKTLMGDTFNGSGAQLYSMVNGNILAAEGTVISVPAMKVGLGDALLTSITFDPSTNSVAVNFSGTIGEDEALIVFATGPQSAGRSPGGNFKKIDIGDDGDIGTFEAGPGYVAIFGGLIEGSYISFTARLVNYTTGESRDAGLLHALVE